MRLPRSRPDSFNRYTAGLLLALLSSSPCLPQTAEASITIASNYVEARVYDNSPGNIFTYDTFTGTTIPSSATLDASLSAQFYSKAQINYSNSGGQTILSIDLDQRREGGNMIIHILMTVLPISPQMRIRRTSRRASTMSTIPPGAVGMH